MRHCRVHDEILAPRSRVHPEGDEDPYSSRTGPAGSVSVEAVLSRGDPLKIVDLASGDQPIFSEDRDSVIVFNGEIYNHLEIRSELESLGRRFQTHCDTETFLQAFLEWDTDCFERLRGMFGLRSGGIPSSGWSWRATGSASSRFISPNAARIFLCVGAERNSHSP